MTAADDAATIIARKSIFSIGQRRRSGSIKTSKRHSYSQIEKLQRPQKFTCLRLSNDIFLNRILNRNMDS